MRFEKPTHALDAFGPLLAEIKPHLEAIDNAKAKRREAENQLASTLGHLSSEQRNLDGVREQRAKEQAQLEADRAEWQRERERLQREIGELHQQRDEEAKLLAEVIAKKNAVRAQTKQLLTTIGE